MARDSAYDAIVERIFFRHYSPGLGKFGFCREEAPEVAAELGVKAPKNLGDIFYSYRFRKSLPASVVETAPEGLEWSIDLAGDGLYEFVLVSRSRIEPRRDILPVKIPDATPEIIRKYATSDEQALLAVLRYNRLVDTFLGITAYSLQNHLRTRVPGLGQIEIDELYVGVNSRGAQFIVPVQAKGGSDYLGVVQAKQDAAFCTANFPLLIPRLVAAQFLASDRVAMFEVAVEAGDVLVVEERHYHLTAADDITAEDLGRYRRQ